MESRVRIPASLALHYSIRRRLVGGKALVQCCSAAAALNPSRQVRYQRASKHGSTASAESFNACSHSRSTLQAL